MSSGPDGEVTWNGSPMSYWRDFTDNGNRALWISHDEGVTWELAYPPKLEMLYADIPARDSS